jgi:A/G-specific adenine glycosylase
MSVHTVASARGEPRVATDSGSARRVNVETGAAARVAAAKATAASNAVVTLLLSWYRAHARDLPWRRPGTTPWAVLVSEIMLQQTPVSRVEPAWRDWLRRWPTPAALAAATPGDAVRAWGSLGYPRRALRLHEAATAIVHDHDGQVPAEVDALRRLPGVGGYTAAAVASFAFRQRHAVLDTNVRRVLGRVFGGVEYPRTGGPCAAERRLAEALLPARATDAARWAVASMEFGALICTARAPRCGECPIVAACAWQRAGAPAYSGPARRGQAYEGTDRQARGRILGRLRSAAGPVQAEDLASVVADPARRRRAIDGLIADGLVEAIPTGYRLPGGPR